MTNLEKYKMYEIIVDDIGDKFCISHFPDGFPEKIYEISVNFTKYENGYFIREGIVTDVGYSFRGELRKPWFDKRPSRKDVEKIKEMSEKILTEVLDKNNIFIHLRLENTTWATSLEALDNGKASLDEDSLILERERLIEKYIPKEGQFKCSYCGCATDDNMKLTEEIISRQYRNFRKKFDYCSSKCASHDQMAHEG